MLCFQLIIKYKYDLIIKMYEWKCITTEKKTVLSFVKKGIQKPHSESDSEGKHKTLKKGTV